MNTNKISSAATIAGLVAVASENSAAIINSSDLGLIGFIVGEDGLSQFNWDIDDAGGRETQIAESVSGPYSSIGNRLNTSQFGFQISDLKLVNLGTSAYVSAGNSFRAVIPGIISYGNINIATGFNSGETGYFGFKFDSNGTTLFGWAEVVITNAAVDNGNFEVIRWAYEDDGSAIRVGQTIAVPEPASTAAGLGLLALGAAGISHWRKSRARRVTSS
ncbi:MAG: hypothetical protein AAGH40_04020 [Verrucomicrobiota bacterium]